MENDRLLINRFAELERRGGCTGFLTLAEQELLRRTCGEYELAGGFEEAERRIALFGGQEPPIACVAVTPLSSRFAGEMGHRDYLGAVLALGLRRETIGDIIVDGKTGYIICLESVAGFIAEQMSEVRRTSVKAAVGRLPEQTATLPEVSTVVVSSERLDGLVAAVFELSRAESAALFERERVTVNGGQARGGSASPRVGDIISVRGMGRFKYEGVERETKKGRLRVAVRKY